jgi:Kef-type K+ transport system membrane component KefB
MRRRVRDVGLYLLFVGLPVLGVLAILWFSPSKSVVHVVLPLAGGGASPAVPMPNLARLLLQVLIIVAVAAAAGRIMQVLGQPRVVGEMIAGIVLGPSVLGALAPSVAAAIFPAISLGFLNSLSQIGLVFFMFLVGMELDPRLLRGRGHASVLASHASIAAPFLLGVLLALVLQDRLSVPGVPFTTFALFLGAALSVTAFPVLARILTERRLLRTRVGAAAIVCAAVDDVTAWCILAMVVMLAGTRMGAPPLWMTLGGTLVYCAAMVWGVRPLLTRLGRYTMEARGLSTYIVATVAMVVLASAWLTEMLGIHALFGAFLAGVIMPREEHLVRGLVQRFEDVMVVVLLPLFFALTGLRTHIGLIHGVELWTICAVIVATAILGKLGGSAVAARATGMSWREAGALGLLMNTRGLMELVILNVGLDIGVISPTLFAMMVIMAIVTTLMTTPLLSWIYPGPPEPKRATQSFHSVRPWKAVRQ